MGAVQDSYITVAWLVLLVVLLVIEIITVGLTTIWGAGGALAALILNILDVPFAGQVVAFFIVTILLLVFTRPFAMRFINTRRLKTNYEGIIGKTIRISQKVDNIGQTGMAVVNDIILLHDCYLSSVKAALRIIDIMQAKGYEFVTVDELLLD